MRNHLHENSLPIEYGRKVKKFGAKGAAILTLPETLFVNGMERGESVTLGTGVSRGSGTVFKSKLVLAVISSTV